MISYISTVSIRLFSYYLVLHIEVLEKLLIKTKKIMAINVVNIYYVFKNGC